MAGPGRKRARRASPRRADEAPPAATRVWLALAAIGVGALLVYANSLANGFVWDDPIILNRQLVVFRSIGDVIVPPRGIPQFSPDYYRPLTVASYLLDRALGGGRPFAFHLSVVFAHAVAAVLVGLLGRQLFGSSVTAMVGAFTAGALFAVHPVHTESVAWAAGRSDVLATCFLLAALVVHGRAPRSWKVSGATGPLAAAALGAKENGIALLPLLLLRDLLPGPGGSAPNRRLHDWVRSYTGPLVAVVVYLLLRRAAIGEFVGSAPGEVDVSDSLPQIVAAAGVYVGKLLWPVGLNASIDQVPVGPGQLALAGLLVAGAGTAALSWWRGRDSAPLFCLLWVAVTLIPSLAIVWKIPAAPIAERYLYLPSVGFCLLVGYGAMRAWAAWPTERMRAALAVALGIVLVAGTVSTVRRNRVWHDDVSLWEETASRSRISGMALRGLGTAYQQRGRLAEARSAFERALQRRNDPRGLQIIYNNLGTLAMHDEDFASAQRYYEQALAANPRAADTLFNLGLAVLHGGGRSRAAAERSIEYLERAQELNPYDPDIDAALGHSLAIVGDEERAIRHLRRALEVGLPPAAADRVRALLVTLESPTSKGRGP